MSNSFMNGIIYSWISPKFRDEVKGLLCKWINSKNKMNRPSHSPTEVTVTEISESGTVDTLSP